MYIGNFEVLSGEVIVTDPCYDIKSGERLKAKNGVYKVSIEEEDGVISKLILAHTDFSPYGHSYTTKEIYELGVDSGQMSVFDIEKYKKDDWIFEEKYPLDIEDNFYGACCYITLHSEENAGTLKYGAVCCSGYGDGDYDGFAKINEQGEVEYIEISFVGEDEEQEEEETYYCENCGCEISYDEAMHSGLCSDCENTPDEEFEED